MSWQDTCVLITGGTGSFGRKFAEVMLRGYKPCKLIIFSRDELKQHEMRTSGFDADCIRYFLGDVRDVDRLRRAFSGVDVVIHAAALKQVPACEYNPFEAVMTNILGARNVVEAALDAGVKKVLAISTDKAVNPVNLYGATKLAAEKLFIQGNVYSGNAPTRFSCIRYGNVVGSRGSVVPLFQQQARTGRLTVTDPRMTRFWLTIEQGVRFVIHAVEEMGGGEIYVPKIPSMKIMDLAQAIAPGCSVETIGIRPGEKLHEILISEDEARLTVELEERFVIRGAASNGSRQVPVEGRPLPEGFRYSSDTNTQWVQGDQFLELLGHSGHSNAREEEPEWSEKSEGTRYRFSSQNDRHRRKQDSLRKSTKTI
jgi:UDP-N-acetylglucosamine 4,6-dehydratase